MIRKPADSLISTHRQQGTTPTPRDQNRPSRKADDRSNPRAGSRRTRVRVEAGFESFSAQIRREMDAHGILETLLLDIVVKAAWDVKQGRGSESNFLEAIDTLERLRRRRVVPLARSLSIPSPEPEEMTDPARSERLTPARVRRESADSPEVTEAEPTTPEPTAIDARWRNRLLLDPEVSDVSPVIRGTWITVSHLVSLVVDGWSWADILRAHPELIEDDIRACLAWTVEQEGAFHVEPAPEKRSNPDRSGQ